MAKRNAETLLNLPETKDIHDRKLRNEFNALLTEAHTLREAEKRLKEVKSRIAEIMTEESLVAEDGTIGARNGLLSVTMSWREGRETLDKERLIDAGVTIEQLAYGMKKGQPYQVVELHELEA